MYCMTNRIDLIKLIVDIYKRKIKIKSLHRNSSIICIEIFNETMYCMLLKLGLQYAQLQTKYSIKNDEDVKI